MLPLAVGHVRLLLRGRRSSPKSPRETAALDEQRKRRREAGPTRKARPTAMMATMTAHASFRRFALVAAASAPPLWSLLLVASGVASAWTDSFPQWVIAGTVPVVVVGWIAVFVARRSVERNPRLSHDQRRQWAYHLRGLWWPVLLTVYVWKHER